ncbi:vacuolar-sorting protein SNF7 [Flagelloscypha sp. PMI_526]|nr:vacuolar-sorting protein SNF7 [Flagelloscypha sp. PMI_526]
MSSFFSYFLPRPDPKVATKDAILDLRQHIALLEKKEAHCQKLVESELQKAKANSLTNKSVALTALRRKKNHESELERIAVQRDQLERQLMTLESASLNMETIRAMKKAVEATERLHGPKLQERVEQTMEDVISQREQVEDIQNLFSQLGTGYDALDEDALKDELDELAHAELEPPESSKTKDQLHTEDFPIISLPRPKEYVGEDGEDEMATLKAMEADLAM